MLSVDRSKKKKGRSLSWSHTFTRMYKRTSYHVCHNCVTVLCNTISNINETKRAYCSSLHMYIYIYILYRHWKYTLFRGYVLANSNFATKTKRALPVLRFFAHELLPNYLLEFPPIFRYFIGEKKKEREIKKECYNEECWTMKKSRVKFSLFIDFNSGKCVKISMIFQEEKKKKKKGKRHRSNEIEKRKSFVRWQDYDTRIIYISNRLLCWKIMHKYIARCLMKQVGRDGISNVQSFFAYEKFRLDF